MTRTDERYSELRYALLVSAYYHDDRESWFSLLNRLTTFTTLALGSSAFATIVSHPHVAAAAAIGVTLLGSFALVFDPAGKSKAHYELKKSFFRLMSDLERGKMAADEVSSEVNLLYAEETGVMNAVLALSQNRAARFVYFDDPNRVELHVGWMARRLRNIVSYKSKAFREVGQSA